MHASRFVVAAAVVAWIPACAFQRAVGRPASPAGYQHVELRDLVATGANDANVELAATMMFAAPSEDCGGLVMLTLIAPGVTTGNPTAAFGAGALTATLPRARYDEVRNLRALDGVRVRGYLSNGVAEHCSASMDDPNARFLWIDTIAPAAATASP